MAVEVIVNFTIERIADLLGEEVRLLSGVKSQVQSLQSELIWMQSYIKDIDAKCEEGDERIRTSTREIRRIAYDVEDIIDSFILEASCQRRHKPLGRYSRIVSSFIRTHQFGTDVEAIKVRIKENTERLQRYGVKSAVEIEGSRKTTSYHNEKLQSRVTRISYSHVKDDDIVGLDEDIRHLVEQLVISVEESKTWVVSVVGMGGLGKTTLAREVYNHAIVRQNFRCRAWVSVSQAWDRRDVLLEIFRQILGGNDGHFSDQELLENLYTYLKEKIYFIVLDDTWKLEAWEDVFPALPRSQGSKILITTRNRTIPLQADPNCIVHEPCLLNDGKSWELFTKKASFDESTSGEFVSLAKEMVKKCNGFPLAISALGGLLRTKKGLEEWERTCRALTSNIMKQNGSPVYGRVEEMLALSYYDLPYELKPCFLYLGVFPEDQAIQTGMLIRMWIAEGFIKSKQLSGKETLEDIGRQCLDELIGRCLIQVAQRNHVGKVVSCRIHDLIRDVCVRKAREQDFLKIHSSISSFSDVTSQSHRAAIHYGDSFPEQNPHLRSLLRIGQPTSKGRLYRELCLKSICQNFRLLRVLNLWGFKTHNKALPKQIGSLVHLRYLGLRLTNIGIFPDSIGNLHNLLTLDCRRIIESVVGLVKLPNVLWKMKNLRHVYLPWGSLSSTDRLGLDTLRNLQTLSGIGGGKWMVRELVGFSPSVQKLEITDISSEEQLEAVFQCPSLLLDHLSTLTLNWLSLSSDADCPVTELKKLELSNCQHLRKLVLKGKIGEMFPLQFPPNLTKLELFCTQLKESDPMDDLGRLQNLKILCMWNSYMGTQLTCKSGAFPRLEKLLLSYLPYLEEWMIEQGSMPQLKGLGICGCNEMGRLPEGLKFISTLERLVLRSMPPLFSKRLRQPKGVSITATGGGEDFHIIQHIPLLRID